MLGITHPKDPTPRGVETAQIPCLPIDWGGGVRPSLEKRSLDLMSHEARDALPPACGQRSPSNWLFSHRAAQGSGWGTAGQGGGFVDHQVVEVEHLQPKQTIPGDGESSPSLTGGKHCLATAMPARVYRAMHTPGTQRSPCPGHSGPPRAVTQIRNHRTRIFGKKFP